MFYLDSMSHMHEKLRVTNALIKPIYWNIFKIHCKYRYLLLNSTLKMYFYTLLCCYPNIFALCVCNYKQFKMSQNSHIVAQYSY